MAITFESNKRYKLGDTGQKVLERNTTVRRNWKASSAVITVIHDTSFRGLGMAETAQTGSLGQ
jgi:hypothetical protein